MLLVFFILVFEGFFGFGDEGIWFRLENKFLEGY
jgi:hypothetical protein